MVVVKRCSGVYLQSSMRVVEPYQFRANRKKKGRKGLYVTIASVILVGIAVMESYWYWHKQQSARQTAAQQTAKTATVKKPVTIDTAKMKPKTFTGNQFRDLYRTVMQTYPNTEEFSIMPAITGDNDADAHIRKLAEARGFQVTRIPVTALAKLNEPLISGEKDDLLQAPAYEAWQQIKAAAKKDNIPLALMSAFRSPEFQRELFMQRLLAKGVTTQQVINGYADNAINANFNVTAVPGYSRHHTGYTVDFWCEDGSGNFGSSSCFRWLEDNNYLHAKQAGWIPSYPEGADEQGPEPESWEYVWVGKEVLYE